MDKPDAVLVMGLTQGALALAIWGDKLVHRILGKKSLEARVGDVEEKVAKCVERTTHDALDNSFTAYRTALGGTLDELHEKASNYATKQQAAVGRIEQRLSAVLVRLGKIDTHLENTDKNVDRIDKNVQRLERRRNDREES